MRKTLVLFALILAFAVCISGYASASEDAGFDFLSFAKEKVLTDFHPTAKPENATAEYKADPKANNDGVVSATVTVFYSGWVRKHQADYEIYLMPNEGLVKVNVLEDTNGVNKLSNKIFKPDSWIELSSLGLEVKADSEAVAAEDTKAADDFDFLTFAREKVLPDFHPTAKPEEANAEYDKDPNTANGITSARIRIRYTSLKTNQDMLALIEVRQGSGLVKVTVIRDSDVLNLTGNKIFRENAWIELSSLE